MEKLYSTSDVANAKGVSRTAVRWAVSRGYLAPLTRINGKRTLVFGESEVQKYLKARPGRRKVKR